MNYDINDEPLKKLLEVFEKRIDLKRTFPEVESGNYQALINWAEDVSKKKWMDIDYESLKNYINWYVEHKKEISIVDRIKNIPQLEILIEIYHKRDELNSIIPESNLQVLINWAAAVSNKRWEDKDYKLLEQYKEWYAKNERTVPIPNRDSIITNFHKLFYGNKDTGHIWQFTKWLGIKTTKCPLDMWVFQEIIVDTKPDLIIESGSFGGGSALFMAEICDSIKKGNIISIDINKADFPKHDRIKFLTGSSVDPKIIDQVKKEIGNKGKNVMVVLDSDHTKNHVLQEMKIYGELVSKGCYMIVEDTNINGHPVFSDFGDGPMEAVNEFFKVREDFIVDKDREKFMLTFNPNGYLKKI